MSILNQDTLMSNWELQQTLETSK